MRLCPATKSYPEGYWECDIVFHQRHAISIIRSLKPNTYHWDDLPSKGQGKVQHYMRLLKEDRWEPQLFANGMGQHPVRFDKNGVLTHGFLRLMAVAIGAHPLRTATVFPNTERFIEDYGLTEDEHADT